MAKKLAYMKTCRGCNQAYWTTAKRTIRKLCLICLKATTVLTRRPTGYLTKSQVNLKLSKMKKDCKRRLK